MKRKLVWAFTTMLGAAIASSSSAKDTIWSPADFDGAWVKVFDNAKNGCWTNIGETQTYATDQLKLAGFEIIDDPETENDEQHPLLDRYRISLLIEVKGSRWNDGLCVGHVVTHFVGSVVPVNNQDSIIVNPIGLSKAWTVWDEENLNTFVLDHVKNYVSRWVEAGRIQIDGE